MPKLIGQQKSITNIQTPQTPDFAAENYANVMKKTMDNYAQAMSSVNSKMNVDNQEAASLHRKAVQAEKDREAAIRLANAKRGNNNGGKILGAIAQLGGVVAKGLQAQEQINMQKDELAYRREQQEFDNDISTRRIEIAESDHALRQDQVMSSKLAAEQQARLDQLNQMVTYQTGEWESQLHEVVINGSREAGYSTAKAYVSSYVNSEEFKTLAPEHQFYINTKLRTWLNEYTGENLSQIEGERKALIDSKVQLASTQVQMRYAPILKEINTGAGVLTQEELNEKIGTIGTIINDVVSSDEALQGLLNSPAKYIEYVANAYAPLGNALNNYYQSQGERSSEAQRYIQAVEGIQALENLRTTPGVGMTDGEYIAQGTLLLTELGLPPNLQAFPTTQTNIARQRNEDYSQITQLEETQNRSENLQRLGENNPYVTKARQYAIGQRLYNALKDGSVEGDIASLEYAIKQSPHEAEARGYGTVLDYFKQFEFDRKTALDLQDELAKREQQYAALKSKITPPTQVEVRIPGDNGLGVDEQGTPLGTSPESRVDIVDVERRVPQATMEELDALGKQLDVTRKRIGELGAKWERRGINIYTPSDPKPFEALTASTQAARDIIQQEATTNGITPETSDNPVPSEPPVTEESTGKLIDTLNNELKLNNFWSVPSPSSVLKDRKLTEPESVATNEALKGLTDNYVKALNSIKLSYAKGETPDIDSVIKGIGTQAKPGSNVAAVGEYKEALVNKLTEASKFLKNKSNWYRDKWGVGRDQGIVPTPNFIDGGQRSKLETVEIPNPRKNSVTGGSSPTMPLRGNLAGTQHGYAPFKGGNVTFNSNYGMRTHPISGKRTMHNGIDLASNDHRVATVQGGTVVHVSPKNGHNGGYGNTVIVKTQDGTYEQFSHLRSVTVTKGQKIDPATQIGLMGGGKGDPGAGSSTGRHLHFEVGTKLVGGYLQGRVDPIGYMKKFTGNVELPRGQGDLGHGTTTNAQPTNSPIVTTGVRKLSENVFISGGYIYDRNTGQFRRANPKEVNKPGIPMTPSSVSGTNINSNAQVSDSGDGGTVIEEWVIPDQAKQEGTFLFVYPTGRTSTRGGQPVLAISGYKNGKKLFSVEAVSGATGISGDRITAGQNGMLPDGKWAVHNITISGAGTGLGDTFLPLISTFGGHNRSNIGIHWDADLDGSTQGSLATLTKADRDKVLKFLNNSGGKTNLYVNTSKVVKVRGASTVNGSHTGNPRRAHNETSPNRVAFSGTNNPDANYGYSGLRNSASMRKALASAGDQLDIPAVWVADYLWSESGFSASIMNKGGSGAMGTFQVMPYTLKWLHPGMTRQEYINKGAVWQLTVSLPKYIKQVEKDAGKKVRTIHDFAAAIWGGHRWLAKSDAERTRLNWSDNDIYWNDYKKKWGSKVGRSYSDARGGADDNIIHSKPRGNCATCQQMLNNQDFTIHSVGL